LRSLRTGIVGSGQTLEEVEGQIRAAREDPNEAVFERVPAADDAVFPGGAALR
jgi:hypothetical protein